MEPSVFKSAFFVFGPMPGTRVERGREAPALAELSFARDSRSDGPRRARARAETARGCSGAAGSGSSGRAGRRDRPACRRAGSRAPWRARRSRARAGRGPWLQPARRRADRGRRRRRTDPAAPSPVLASPPSPSAALAPAPKAPAEHLVHRRVVVALAAATAREGAVALLVRLRRSRTRRSRPTVSSPPRCEMSQHSMRRGKVGSRSRSCTRASRSSMSSAARRFSSNAWRALSCASSSSCRFGPRAGAISSVLRTRPRRSPRLH